MDTELEARLRQMADKQEIYDVLMRYCRGVDRRDRDLIASCYHPDGIDDRREKVSGHDLADRVAVGPVRQKMSMHLIANVLIEVEGDVAYSEAYCIGYLALEPKDGALDTGFGQYEKQPILAKEYLRALGFRYVDRFERRNGSWKIAYRTCIDDWHRVDPLPDLAPGSPHGRIGLRSMSDPGYAFRAGELPPARDFEWRRDS